MNASVAKLLRFIPDVGVHSHFIQELCGTHFIHNHPQTSLPSNILVLWSWAVTVPTCWFYDSRLDLSSSSSPFCVYIDDCYFCSVLSEQIPIDSPLCNPSPEAFKEFQLVTKNPVHSAMSPEHKQQGKLSRSQGEGVTEMCQRSTVGRKPQTSVPTARTMIAKQGARKKAGGFCSERRNCVELSTNVLFVWSC